MLRGRLSGDFDPDTVTREELGAAMTGADAPESTPTADTPPDDPHTEKSETQGDETRTDEGDTR